METNLQTQPNEKRCRLMTESHTLSIANCCPISKNPLPGSKITITYTPTETLLEVAALKKYIDSYTGGRGDVRSMEGMVQSIAKDCSKALEVNVEVVAKLKIAPEQEMKLTCTHYA